MKTMLKTNSGKHQDSCLIYSNHQYITSVSSRTGLLGLNYAKSVKIYLSTENSNKDFCFFSVSRDCNEQATAHFTTSTELHSR